ncbi:unnamed protein product [Medioppia subpectinata]|uniref:Protein kinase domain-containing protein n=1 Tax=Medioppia subpectinata TaxID=1979941 RepID=A0A7R9KM03_9ACAR|nr:unnamed protein product [Medioppia subpectinata]CAG2105954.1 unnamed protein product [Medioppia subpectinata]
MMDITLFRPDNTMSYRITREEYKIERYERLQHLGTGGFGEVFTVKAKHNGKIHAIKKCQLNILTAKEKQSIMNESHNLIKLRSEYVIKFYYSWIQNNCLYILMDCLAGNLSDVIKAKKKLFGRIMTEFEYYISFNIFKQLVESVKYLHNKNVIHRDLKPDNVLIDNENNYRYIKLCDFGLSKSVDVLIYRYRQSSAKHTADVVQYMAPEGQTTEYNHLIDVYSLALIGAKIFGFDSEDIRDGVLNFDFHTINNFILRRNLSEIYQLLLSMSVSIEYRKIDWKLRPECEILLKL